MKNLTQNTKNQQVKYIISVPQYGFEYVKTSSEVSLDKVPHNSMVDAMVELTRKMQSSDYVDLVQDRKGNLLSGKYDAWEIYAVTMEDEYEMNFKSVFKVTPKKFLSIK